MDPSAVLTPQAADDDLTAYLRVPGREITCRIQGVQEELHQRRTGGFLLTQPVDIYYLSSLFEARCLYLPADGDPLLVLDETHPDPKELPAGFRCARSGSLGEIPGLIESLCGPMPETLAMELDVLPVAAFQRYRELCGPRQYVDGSDAVLKVRRIKSEWEIEQMRSVARVTAETFASVSDLIRPGLSEMAFSGLLEAHACKLARSPIRLRVRHYLTEGYPWHVLSGDSGGRVGLLDSPASGTGTSAAFPCGAGPRPMGPDEPIMVDFAFGCGGYHLDETRMFAMNSMPQEALRACEAVIAVHDAVLAAVRPGVAVGELFALAASRAESLGYAEAFLGPPGYKVSFIGHGIGLELIEGPIIAKNKADLLEPGMTFALEPKMVFENRFIAGIESVFMVTEAGGELITRIPVEVFTC